jgi:hypothetical protein
MWFNSGFWVASSLRAAEKPDAMASGFPVETRLAASETGSSAETGQAPSLQAAVNRSVHACPLQQSLGAGTGYVDHGRIGDDLIEDRLNGRDLDQFISARQVLHSLEFFV